MYIFRTSPSPSRSIRSGLVLGFSLRSSAELHGVLSVSRALHSPQSAGVYFICKQQSLSFFCGVTNYEFYYSSTNIHIHAHAHNLCDMIVNKEHFYSENIVIHNLRKWTFNASAHHSTSYVGQSIERDHPSLSYSLHYVLMIFYASTWMWSRLHSTHKNVCIHLKFFLKFMSAIWKEADRVGREEGEWERLALDEETASIY